jgi:hypothetical protein
VNEYGTMLLVVGLRHATSFATLACFAIIYTEAGYPSYNLVTAGQFLVYPT